jgi:hypothetical protein
MIRLGIQDDLKMRSSWISKDWSPQKGRERHLRWRHREEVEVRLE